VLTVLKTRRQILIAISQLAAAATLASCSDSSTTSDNSQSTSNTDLELLASVTYDFLPYPELNPAVYVKAAQQILDLDSDNVRAGLTQLREASGNGAWKDLAEDQRIAILTSLEGSAFFAEVRANTMQVLLREPETFKIVGYGGSTIEHGGYINRGFNDIDWLPAE
jgi:hypothetical protein